MYGRLGGELSRKNRRHMWSLPSPIVVGDRGTVDSFFKDGRKISIGDCALFKPPQDSPAFIGIIRWLTPKEKNLQLGVNWLYRPADVKLGKGFLLDAVPNEVFYSFHSDEIPAASLLHPCKVAFLPKDTELPPGILSFVCWRVYDIARERLWWLTDPDYINARQKEVNQLLFKTRKEMHTTFQSGRHSPKAINGQTTKSQLKPGSDNVQHSASSFPSHTKRKKRDHADQGLESVKRERHSKVDESESNRFKADSILKSEVANIAEKGGLVDFEGVEKLVKLMQLNKVDKKMDLIGRSMLVGVVAMTDKFDCLTQFVQLRGLPVLDEWLQDIHKGKIDAGSGAKDGDKYVEEFLMVLLRALDKLPVNLHALKMCNIGRSVNHLRTHKNLEIQKKARSLVDTWKKRVEVEMNILDSKSGSSQAISWPSKSRTQEVPQGGNRHFGDGSEISKKSSISLLPASKSSSPRPLLGETTTKSASSSPGPIKSAVSPGSGKDGQPRISVGCGSDLPSTPAREEKSSSSSQSHNYSQSLSGKEDARSSTAGSMSVHKMSGGTSKNRKSVNGGPGPAVSGVQRECGLSKTASLQSASTSERMSGLTCEKILEMPIVEGRNHKLIVKIPNRGRSPALSTSGGFSEDPSMMDSKASSPLPSEKHENFDRNMKEKNDARRVSVTSDVNTESWQSNDFKDALAGSDEGDVSPDAVHNDDISRTMGNARESVEASKLGSLSAWDELTSEKNFRGSALFTNVVQPSLSAGDDVGMNLLASVAAGEMSKSNLISPTDTLGNHVILENPCMGNLSSSPGDTVHSRSNDGTQKDRKLHSSSQSLDSCGRNTTCSLKDMPEEQRKEHPNCFSVNIQSFADQSLGTTEKIETKDANCVDISHANIENVADGEASERVHVEKEVMTTMAPEDILANNGCNSLEASDKDNVSASMQDEKAAAEVHSPHLSFTCEAQNNNCASEVFNNDGNSEQMRPSTIAKSENVQQADSEMLQPSCSSREEISVKHGELKVVNVENVERFDTGSVCEAVKEKPVHDANDSRVIEGSTVSAKMSECMEEEVKSKDAQDQSCGEPFSLRESPSSPSQETEHVKLRVSKAGGSEKEETEEHASAAADASVSTEGGEDVDAKPKFDLNEGFNVEDGRLGNVSLTASERTSSIHLISPLPFPVTTVSSCLPASITVAAAAKGPFVPIQDLLRSKAELGWKGSAATSAFRPAEPRRVMDMPLASNSSPLPDTSSRKSERPMLDFDLNVVDERILEDMTSQDTGLETCSLSEPKSKPHSALNELTGSAAAPSSGRFDLDLNRVVEASDIAQYPSVSVSSRLESPLLQVKSTSLGGFPTGEVQRGFDLNNGPVIDEESSEQLSFSERGRSSLQSQLAVGSIRMNSADIGNLSSWYSPGNAYPAVTIPSFFHEAGNKPFSNAAPQKMVGTPTGGAPDVYRGPVLSSSPAVPYPPTAFQYPVFPGTGFALTPATFTTASTPYMDSSAGGRFCLPGVNSQLLGPAATVASHIQRPYMVGIPEGSSNGGMENNRKWARQGLDLNAGPSGLDMEGRDETMLLASRQFSIANSQALAEEQARKHLLAGGVLKRKEPEDAWDAESFRYKQSSWQ